MQSNIFIVNLDFDTFQIEQTPYSDEKLLELREKFNETHSFFRNGNNIYISNKDDETESNIGNPIELSVSENEKIVGSLIKNIFFRTFKDRFPHILPILFSPFRFFSRNEKDDLVFNLLPENLKNILSYVNNFY